ncbi:MAG TPA: TrmH family RNA methyltransferase [Polyangiaceae bacterium]|nr:TrmH family RNA methyltransferase [Polyangiaceae bacterium]
MNVFLYAPQDFRNLCVLSRTLEVLGLSECFVFDPFKLIRERYGRYRVREQRVVSAGAFQKIRWQRVEEPESFLTNWQGRVVGTVAEAGASALYDFRFTASDLVLFGSESAGLPEPILARCTERLTIVSRGQTQSLNLAVALGVVLFECSRQLGA